MIVIADDITGAAEIAGIAFQHGLQVHLSIGADGEVSPCDVHVIATDTRSMTEQEAVPATKQILMLLTPHPSGQTSQPSPLTSLFFKKTDSALRGHVIAELSALMQVTGCQRAVFLPANPSKGRVIRQGVYRINGVPIHQTDFSFDPEFPATTSSMEERFPDAAEHHVIMPDACSVDDIIQVVNEYDDGHTFFAGAADLFTVLLTSFTSHSNPSSLNLHSSHPSTLNPQPSTLFLCGSTQSVPPDIGLPVCPMPLSVYEGESSPSLWFQQMKETYTSGQGVILTIPHRHLTGRAVAIRLRETMAWMTNELIKIHRPQRLVIEGGATAFACLNAVGWHQFQVTKVFAPGVVAMTTPEGSTVILKPGSYPWHKV